MRGERRRWVAAAAPALLVAMILPGCRASGYVFRQDERVRILSPRAQQEINLPLVLRWQVTDFRVTGPGGDASEGAGYFALFVDRSPMAPGQDLRDLVSDDESCLRTPGCPDESMLNQRGVYTTTATSLEIEGLADTRPKGRSSAVDSHDVTIVLLNARGERIGEAAWTVIFSVDRSREPVF